MGVHTDAEVERVAGFIQVERFHDELHRTLVVGRRDSPKSASVGRSEAVGTGVRVEAGRASPAAWSTAGREEQAERMSTEPRMRLRLGSFGILKCHRRAPVSPDEPQHHGDPGKIGRQPNPISGVFRSSEGGGEADATIGTSVTLMRAGDLATVDIRRRRRRVPPRHRARPSLWSGSPLTD
jgi:hypothetical protein